MRASVNKTYLDILGSRGHHSGDHEESAYSCLGNGKARIFLVVMVVCSEISPQLCTRSRNAPYAAYRPFVAGCWLTTRHLLLARLRSPLLFHGKNGERYVSLWWRQWRRARILGARCPHVLGISRPAHHVSAIWIARVWPATRPYYSTRAPEHISSRSAYVFLFLYPRAVPLQPTSAYFSRGVNNFIVFRRRRYVSNVPELQMQYFPFDCFFSFIWKWDFHSINFE